MARACFPMFPSFQHGKPDDIVSSVSFLFSRCKLCLRYTTGEFNENPSMPALAKLLGAIRARPNFASTFKLDGTIRYPYCVHVSTAILKLAERTIDLVKNRHGLMNTRPCRKSVGLVANTHGFKNTRTTLSKTQTCRTHTL